eukprot:TRINITY_DN7536_c0_g1_i2.p1 TRINITY_DN7536_c0_g1~~TRINITY_DN7536_c0_g1_i2.p1  ORF type:complete len:242 (-),score=15.82 TRINITY_DN7536_c0_g1_i2:227-952(-)
MLSLRSVTVSAPSTARRRPPLARLPRTSVVDLGAVAVPQTPRTITTADLHMHQLTSMRDTVRRDQDRSDLATYGTVYVGAIDRESISRVSSRLSMHGGQTPTFTPRPIPEPITSLVIGGALRAIKSAPKPPRASVIGPKPSVPVRRAILRGMTSGISPGAAKHQHSFLTVIILQASAETLNLRRECLALLQMMLRKQMNPILHVQHSPQLHCNWRSKKQFRRWDYDRNAVSVCFRRSKNLS